MLKENWTNTDKFNYNDYNIIITNIINLCKKSDGRVHCVKLMPGDLSSI